MDASCKTSVSKQWSLPLMKVRNTFIEPAEGGNASARSTHSDPTGLVSKPAPVSVKLPESWKRKKNYRSQQAETSSDTKENSRVLLDLSLVEKLKDSAASEALVQEGFDSTRDAARSTCMKACAQGEQVPSSQMPITEITQNAAEVACARKASKHVAGDTMKVVTMNVDEVAEAPHEVMCGKMDAKAPKTEPEEAEKAMSKAWRQKESTRKYLNMRDEPSVTLAVDISGIDAFAHCAIVGASPWFGNLHAFHSEARRSGHLSTDGREFAKTEFAGRLTVLSERRMLSVGQQTYLVMFTHGELSVADGVGFVFSNSLPCPKNIQKITSIFVNQRGQICLRMQAEVVKFSICTKPLQIGDLIGMKVDMEARQICFVVWPADGGPPAPAIINFGIYQETKKGSRFSKDMPGHFACVAKNVGMTLRLLS